VALPDSLVQILLTGKPDRYDSGINPHEELARLDPKFAPLIERFGPLSPSRDEVCFHSFASSIMGQQLSGKAADTIARRTREGLGLGDRFESAAFDGHTPETLRSFGVSRQKAGYLLDLAARTNAGEIHFHRFDAMEDEAIIEELIKVKGIGRWTIQMVLIFDLARPDIIAGDDMGLQEGLRILDGLDLRPKPKELVARAEAWRPLRSYASLYLWKLKDNPA
jgi:DNA-3-methyladenine glycosylase II